MIDWNGAVRGPTLGAKRTPSRNGEPQNKGPITPNGRTAGSIILFAVQGYEGT